MVAVCGWWGVSWNIKQAMTLSSMNDGVTSFDQASGLFPPSISVLSESTVEKPSFSQVLVQERILNEIFH